MRGLARVRSGAAPALAALALILGLASEAHAQSAASEAAVKAAFVYNFAKFTSWPSASFATGQSPLVLCVIGTLEAALAQAFDSVDGKTAQARPIRLKRAPKRDELASCHILYIADGDTRRPADLVRPLAQRAVLTVSDAEGFAEGGGMIGLVHVEDRIQFEINVEATQHAGLTLSSQLLRLARIVKDPRGKERR